MPQTKNDNIIVFRPSKVLCKVSENSLCVGLRIAILEPPFQSKDEAFVPLKHLVDVMDYQGLGGVRE